MEPPPDAQSNEAPVNQTGGATRSQSFSSQKSSDSHTAAEYAIPIPAVIRDLITCSYMYQIHQHAIEARSRSARSIAICN